MRVLVGVLGAALLLIVLWDAFETVVLPRHVTRSFRLARFFFRSTWRLWTTFARGIHTLKRRETYLSFFGPLSVLLLLAFWAAMLVLAFAMLLWAGGAVISGPGGSASFRTDLYFSGTTFFTLGLGDVIPVRTLARVIAATSVGVDPRTMGIGPVPAMRKLQEKTGLHVDDYDLGELNEAFAAQVLACNRELHFDRDRLNVNGGAIALGHPIGCTGARITVTLVHEMLKREAKKGVATLCVSGGLGMALAIENAS